MEGKIQQSPFIIRPMEKQLSLFQREKKMFFISKLRLFYIGLFITFIFVIIIRM